MSSEWEQVNLTDVCSDVSYGYTESATNQPVGPKFLRITDIQGGSFDWDTVPFCTATEDCVRKYQLEVGDIVVARTGNSTGENAQVVQEPPAAVFASYLIRFRPNSERVNPFFVGYLLRSERFKQHVLAVRGGSAQPGANAKQLGSFVFHLIPRHLQNYAVESLRALDDRIALLRETNATLEAIAQALFKSWFVDFEPVHAKARGKQPQGMDDATAALFPDSFEESEQGMIPKGWQVKSFGEFVTRQSVGKKYDQKSALPEGLIPILDQGKSGIIGFHNDEPGVRASLDKPVVVFANHTCYMRLITFDFSAIQNVLPFIGKGIDTVWAFYATKDRVKFSEYKGHWPDFAIEKAVIPDDHLTFAFRNIVDSIVRGMRSNEQQAQTLAQLRDTLLPKLISGQLRLPEAEALLAEELP